MQVLKINECAGVSKCQYAVAVTQGYRLSLLLNLGAWLRNHSGPKQKKKKNLMSRLIVET